MITRVWLGDRVKVTAPDPARARNAGKEGVVVAIEADVLDSEGAATIKISLPNGARWWFRPDELTHVDGPDLADCRETIADAIHDGPVR